MDTFLSFLPHLLAMAALTVASGFFSCSEAALFYLGREDREQLALGSSGARAAALLLERPERLLTSILFWNLVINMAYFSLSSMVALGLEKSSGARYATGFAIGSLILIIVVSEMLPKTLGVMRSRQLSALVGLPLSLATRLLDPLLPSLLAASRVCQRLVAPEFVSEPYMELGDLERAITLSGSDPALVEQERNILSRVVALAEVRVEEVMRPRRQYLAFQPPVTTDDLGGQTTPSGYLLITEPESEEIASAIAVERAALLPAGERLDLQARSVVLVPWSATAAATLSELRRLGRRVAAVLNEMGETIGIVTLEDLLDEVLQPEPAPKHPHDRPGKLTDLGDSVWQATGRTTLRRVAKQLRLVFPATKGITVGGLIQEQLQRLPEVGDLIEWGDLQWEVKQADEATNLLVELRPLPNEPSDQTPTPHP